MSFIRLRLVRVPLAFVGLGLLGLALGCNRTGVASPAADAAPAQAPVVSIVKPERKTLSRVIEQPAFVEAYEETPLLARISGYVQKVRVDIGDRVKGPRFDEKGEQLEPGQVLAELWVPEMEEELRQKQALVAQAEAEVEQAAASVDAAEASIATALAMILEAEAGRERAQATYERWDAQFRYEEDLVRRKSLDQQSLDITKNQRKAADATRKEVEAKVALAKAASKESEAKHKKAQADHRAAKAKVQVAKAEEGRLAAMLAYSKVRAPFDGVITSRTVATGHYLAGTGMKPLFVVARLDIVRITADLQEADARDVRPGVPARIRFETSKEADVEGKVTRTSGSLDAKSRTLRVEIELANPQGRLRPGMYAYVFLNAELPSRFTLPVSAVVTQGGQAAQSFCCIVENGKASRVPLKLGVRDAQVVQVLKKQTKPPAKAGEPGVWEDLTGEEQVVLSNPASLTDGQVVTVGPKP